MKKKSKKLSATRGPVKTLTSGNVYYFGAGPAAIPAEVKQKIMDELPDYHGTGISILELGHRSEAFLEIVDSSEKRLRSLLSIPDDYSVLFLPAGARVQFSVIPLNLTKKYSSVDYILTGHWSRHAAKEATRYCSVNIAASSEADDFQSIPASHDWQLDDEAAYVYLTSNETIQGVEFHTIPDCIKRPLVSDMTSNLLTRPIDVARYGLIFAGTQKNLGTAGLCVAIVKKELTGRARPETPLLFNYIRQENAHSLMNTPPVVSWYVMDLVFEWLQQQGGVAALEKRHIDRSTRLYRLIDDSDLYQNTVSEDCRSRVNVTFNLSDESLCDTFVNESENAGLLALRGHRSVGGFRASLYNAMPDEGVETLMDFMRDFEQRKG